MLSGERQRACIGMAMFDADSSPRPPTSTAVAPAARFHAVSIRLPHVLHATS